MGSLIEIRYFSPLFTRAEDGPSSLAPRKVLALDIKKAKLRGAAGEGIWGSPQPLDSVQDLKDWVHELRKPDGDRCAHLLSCLRLTGLTVRQQRPTQDQEEATR